MKRTILVAALVVSVAVGMLAFAAPGKDRPGHKGGGKEGHGGFGRFLNNPHLLEDLDLSDEQLETLRTLRYEAKKAHITLKAEADQSRGDLHHLLGDDEPDEAAIMAVIESGGEAHVALQKSDVQHMLKQRAVLGTEKWGELKRLAEKKHRQHRRFKEGRGRDGPGRFPHHRGPEERPRPQGPEGGPRGE